MTPMTENIKRQLNFELKFLNTQLFGHSIVLKECVFIWFGHSKTDTLSFGHGERSMLLSGQPLPNEGAFLQSFNLKLNKLFSGRQVFFSTDIVGEDLKPAQWHELFTLLKEHIDDNMTFYSPIVA
jgi:hypothetical protein